MTLLVDTDLIVYSVLNRKTDFLLAIDSAEASLFRILARFSDADYDLYLTGKNNFRKKVASYYKAHRPTEKPRYFSDLRSYLVDEWGAIVVDEIEADDAIGIRHCEHTIVVSIDKDLKTLSGWNYNFRTDELVNISEQEAATNFWVQMLIGDASDNVPGIKNPAKAHHKNPPNFTEATAKQILLDLDGTLTMRQTVEKLYESQFGNEWQEKFNEIATLLFIQRKDALTWQECNLLK